MATDRALAGDLIKAMMGTILAYITFAGAMAGAIYLLANDKPLYGLAALVTALGAAFGPKIYAYFIQPNATPSAPHNQLNQRGRAHGQDSRETGQRWGSFRSPD